MTTAAEASTAAAGAPPPTSKRPSATGAAATDGAAGEIEGGSSSKRPRGPSSEGPADGAAASSSKSMVQNEYTGFTFPTTGPRAVETLDLDELYARHGNDEGAAATVFFRDYVAARKPVLIKGRLRDPDWAADRKWTDAYLAERAGGATVMVEAREDAGARFGRGRETPMAFARFLEELGKGSELLYLTTQELELGPDDRPAIMSSPVTELRGDFPLRPALLGRLVPQNMNLWMGRSAAGSTSGLHHDYHDNLYVLLRGLKTFRLYSPADAPRMYTVGALARVHANGRVNYADQPPTHADGRELGADRAFEAAERLREAAAAAFGGGGSGGGGAAEDAALDAALDAVLDAEVEGEEGEEGFGSDGDEEDDEDGALTPPWPPGEEEGEGEAGHRVDADADGKEAEGAEGAPPAVGAGEPTEKPPPRNFSRVQDPFNPDRGAFPDFPAAPPVEVTVAPGSMLYLPAGWFHEVISSGGTHAAMNWWFHPPDTADFARPYASRFWPRDWEERMALEGAKTDDGRA